jgi:RNA 2',3'-cyclic 3'-phosphodiesterase
VTPGPRLRLFLAAWPDDATRAAAARLRSEVAAREAGVSVPEENLHVTLAFLGGVPADRCAEAGALARGLPVAAHTLVLDRLEYFRGARVLAATASQVPAALERLHLELLDRCRRQDFPVDSRHFRPHLTLARGLEPEARPLPKLAPFVWPVRAVSLVESRPMPAGRSYLVLAQHPLAADESGRSAP